MWEEVEAIGRGSNEKTKRSAIVFQALFCREYRGEGAWVREDLGCWRNFEEEHRRVGFSRSITNFYTLFPSATVVLLWFIGVPV